MVMRGRFILLTPLLILAPLLALAQDGVASSTPNEVVGKFYQFGLMAGGILAFGAIVWGGIEYALAAGNPGKQGDAKDRVVQALIGLALLAASYVILSVINPLIITGTIGELGELEAPVTPAEVAPSVRPPDSAIEERLRAAGITLGGAAVVSTLQESIVQELLRIKAACPECDMLITAGTNGTHTCDVNHPCNHCNGYKVDLLPSPSLTSYVESSFGPSYGHWSDGTPLYRDPSTGAVWANEGDHWDVASC
jgi:hypothetical protein